MEELAAAEEAKVRQGALRKENNQVCTLCQEPYTSTHLCNVCCLRAIPVVCCVRNTPFWSEITLVRFSDKYLSIGKEAYALWTNTDMVVDTNTISSWSHTSYEGEAAARLGARRTT